MSNSSSSAASSRPTDSPTSINNDTNSVAEAAPTPTPRSTSRVETGTAILNPVQEPTPSTVVEAPSPPAPAVSESETPQATEQPPSPPPPPPPPLAPPVPVPAPAPKSSTNVPPILIRTTSTSSRSPETQAPISILISTSTPETPTTLETTIISLTPSSSRQTRKSSPAASSSTSVPPPSSGSPFEKPENQSNNGKSGKSSGSKIGGAIGGLSAAILLGLILFFAWKWKSRGKYRFNKRQSFDPYGNGIDANRGGLLVSAIACKPGDQVSSTNTAYSDDNSPTRYQRRSVDVGREPTIPVLKDSPPSQPAYPNMTAQPPRPVGGYNDPTRDHFHSYQPEMTMAAMAPLTRPSQRQPPVLYDRRRPPVPPSMRRNRSPPDRSYDAGAMEMQQGISPATSPRDRSMMGAPVPGLYPSSSQEYAAPGFHAPRSNSISSQMPTRVPDLAHRERHQRVRRSMSLGSLNTMQHDPLSMHPVIPEVPSPRISTHHTAPGGLYQRSLSLTGTTTRAEPLLRGPTNSFWNDPEPPRQLMVRNPSPPPAEKSRKQLGDMVRRMGSMRQGGENKVPTGLAAKNF